MLRISELLCLMSLALCFFGDAVIAGGDDVLKYRVIIKDKCISGELAQELKNNDVWFFRDGSLFVVEQVEKEFINGVVMKLSKQCKPPSLTRCYWGEVLENMEVLLEKYNIQYTKHIGDGEACLVYKPKDLDAVDALELDAAMNQ